VLFDLAQFRTILSVVENSKDGEALLVASTTWSQGRLKRFMLAKKQNAVLAVVLPVWLVLCAIAMFVHPMSADMPVYSGVGSFIIVYVWVLMSMMPTQVERMSFDKAALFADRLEHATDDGVITTIRLIPTDVVSSVDTPNGRWIHVRSRAGDVRISVRDMMLFDTRLKPVGDDLAEEIRRRMKHL
jgi:hypothetical protein